MLFHSLKEKELSHYRKRLSTPLPKRTILGRLGDFRIYLKTTNH